MKNLIFIPAVFVTSILFTSAIQGQDICSASSAEVAASRLSQDFVTLQENLPQFDADIMPHEAKKLRKQLGNFRTVLDLFIYSYATVDKAFVFELRDVIDDGYEMMGAFKDIRDRETDVPKGKLPEYDLNEVRDARQLVLDWQRQFADFTRENDIVAFLNQPKDKFKKTKEKLSRFFWGTTKQIPSKDLSALQNLSLLSVEILQDARKDLPGTLALEKIVSDAGGFDGSEEVFHDFRKRLRALKKITKFFPGVIPAESAEMIDTVNELVGNFGDINDIIIAYEHDHSATKAAKINQLWTALRTKMQQSDWDHFLAELENRFAQLEVCASTR